MMLLLLSHRDAEIADGHNGRVIGRHSYLFSSPAMGRRIRGCRRVTDYASWFDSQAGLGFDRIGKIRPLFGSRHSNVASLHQGDGGLNYT